MTKSDELKAFVQEYVDYFENEGSGGSSLDFPNFDLLPHSFLDFADKELEHKESDRHLINCVSHLKRAAECQIDTFLSVCNLYNTVRKNNLGFDAKLDFLKSVRVFDSRTLSRFNTIRNKIEHEYAIPHIEDIEVYYDLVSALIEVIEGVMFIMAHGSELIFMINKGANKKGIFKIAYDFKYPSINASWSFGEETTSLTATFSKEDRENFIYFLKLLILLNKSTCLMNAEWVLQEI